MASPLNPTKNVEGFIKHDIMGLFDDFREQKMDIKINYGIITLLPKIKNATKI
jgi:hypothetical protein